MEGIDHILLIESLRCFWTQKLDYADNLCREVLLQTQFVLMQRVHCKNPEEVKPILKQNL